MRGRIILLFALILLSCSLLSQIRRERKTKIALTEFEIVRTGYTTDCELTNLPKKVYGNDQYLVFFIKTANNPLHLLKVSNNNHQQDSYLIDDDLSFKVKLFAFEHFAQRNFHLYAVVLEGRVYSLKRTLELIEGDMYKIEDALNVLYKAKQKPLAYTELIR